MKYLIGIVLLSLSLLSYSQDSDFNSLIYEVKNNLLEVKTGGETYTQELELLNYSVLKYTLIEVNEKGDRKEESFEFNVADLDPYVVREETKKDIIYLSMTVGNGQKFIKKYEDGEVKGYEESISMVTKDIDNARILKDLIKKAIPLAKAIMSKKLSVNTYDEMANWLTKNIVNAESSGKTYNQTLYKQEDFPANFRFVQTVVTSKSSQEKQYIFNLSDININSLKFNISGSSFSLDFKTNRKQKVIKVLEDSAPKGFEDEIEIFTNNVEEARDLKNILTKAVPLSDEMVKSSIPRFESMNTALEYLGKHVQNIDYGDESLEQLIEGDCLMELTLIDADAKSTKKIVSTFNLIDINKDLIDYDVSSDKMFVEFSTKESLDLMKRFENDEFDGYGDDLKIYVENVEIARRIKASLEGLIKICERDYVDPFADMNISQKINWLTMNLGEARIGDKTVNQTFERLDESDTEKIKLIKLEVNTKGSTEEIFEFNFADINLKSIQYKIGSKTLSISFETKFKEDIIKYYKNGEIENYQDGFELSMTDIETARNVILVFNHIIAELNE
ncbi:hypothetical protein [Ekhidna sp.]